MYCTHRQNLRWRQFPSSQPVLQNVVGDTGGVGPFYESLGFAVMRHSDRVAPVPVLNDSVSPSAVPRGIRPVVIDPVNGVQGRWSRSHVSVEDCEVVPLGADDNAAPAVVGIGPIVGIRAALTDALPDCVLGNIPSLAVCSKSQTHLFPTTTPTRGGVMRKQALSQDSFGCAAIADCLVLDSTVRTSLLRKSNDGKSAEFRASRNGTLRGHRINLRCQTRAVSAAPGRFVPFNFTTHHKVVA